MSFKADDFINGDEELLPDNTQVLLAIRDVRRKKSLNTPTRFLVLTLQVLEGPHKKHRFDYRVTMECENAKAVTIGKQQLARICKASGLDGFEDEDELIGAKFSAIAKVRPGSGQYRATQEISPVLTQAQQAKSAVSAPAKPVVPVVEEAEDFGADAGDIEAF